MKLIIKNGSHAVLSQLDALSHQARTLLTEQALTDSTPLVPYDTHALAESAFDASQPEQGILAWNTPYARIRYTSGKPKQPGTVTHWLEHAAESHSGDWVQHVSAALSVRS